MSSFLRISLGLNLVLAGIVATLLWRGRSQELPEHELSPSPASARSGAAKSAGETGALPSEQPEQKITPSALVQLERLGIPRDTLVNALIETLNRKSTQQVVALQKKYAPKLVPEREMIELSRQSAIEQTRELKEALGEEGYRAWDKEQTLRALNRARVPGDELPMTDDEAEQAYRLQKDFDQKARDLQMAMEDGVADKADAGTLQAQAQQALDRDLEKLLGRDRFNALRSNSAPTTEVYRSFGDLNPSPEQASAIVRADEDFRAKQAALARKLAGDPARAGDLTGELQALADAREQTYRQLFGSEAYDNFKLTHDPTYQTLNQYADAWNLNHDEVNQVYQSVNAFQQQADHLRTAASLRQEAGEPVDWKAVNAAIEQAQQRAEAGLQATIGPERLRRLKQNGILDNGGPSG